MRPSQRNNYLCHEPCSWLESEEKGIGGERTKHIN